VVFTDGTFFVVLVCAKGVMAKGCLGTTYGLVIFVLSFFFVILFSLILTGKGNIGNMDEVPMYFDMLANSTFAPMGSKYIEFISTGNHKVRFTVILAGLDNGRLLKPMILWKNLKHVPKECKAFRKDLAFAATKGGSVNQEVMKQWFREVWFKRPSKLATIEVRLKNI